MVLSAPLAVFLGFSLAGPAGAVTPEATAAAFQDRIAALSRQLSEEPGSPREEAARKRISDFILFPANGFVDMGSQAVGFNPLNTGTSRAVQGEVREAVRRWTAARPDSAAQLLAVIGEDEELAEAGHQGLFPRAPARARSLLRRLSALRGESSDGQGEPFPALVPDDFSLAAHAAKKRGYGDIGPRAERFLELSARLCVPLNAAGPPERGFSFGSVLQGFFE